MVRAQRGWRSCGVDSLAAQLVTSRSLHNTSVHRCDICRVLNDCCRVIVVRQGESIIKTLRMVMAVAGVAALTGCAVYPAGHDAYGNYGTTYGGNAGGPYVVEQPQPVYIYGSGTYRSDGYARPRAYGGPARPRGAARDQDRDGIPNRYDRDRDGDGVPNRIDSRPYDPGRR